MSKGKAEGYVIVKTGGGKCGPGLTLFAVGGRLYFAGFPIKSLSPNKILKEKIHCSCQI